MLITNFASGELSENLFGRIDLPQYFQGVSRLENFDVVPTGGIERRKGLRRLIEMERPGRIIPFIIDRGNSYILYLSPEIPQETGKPLPARLSIYSQEGELESYVDSTEDVPLYRTMEEINLVQYAQNYDLMVLVHEDYAPLKVYADEGLHINLFLISALLDVVFTGRNYPKVENVFDDSTVNFMANEKNYPRSVSFISGRIVFAGTKTYPQRLYFSRTGYFENFTTRKRYITEKLEYIAVSGTVVEQDDTTVKINLDSGEGGKINRPVEDYIITSPFKEGSKIQSINGTVLKISGKLYSLILEQEDRNRVNATYSKFMEQEYSYNYRQSCFLGVFNMTPVDLYFFPTHAKGYVGAQEYDIKEYQFNTDIAKLIIENDGDFYDYIKSIAIDYVNFLKPKYTNDITKDFTWAYRVDGSDFFLGIVDVAKSVILGSMNCYIHALDVTLYDRGDNIRNYIYSLTEGADHITIAMYTSDYIEDRTVTPDDGFTFEIASDMSDAIKWIGQSKNLLVGTETAEWVIPAGVNATNVQAILNSRYGSDNVQGTAVGDSFCFIQTGRKAVVEYYIPQQDNNFRANNMAMLSKNMLGESAVFDIDFTSAPYTKLFISREDGTVVCLLYERTTGTFAWGRITTQSRMMKGYVKSVAVLPGDGQDEVYFIVERNGHYYLERLDNRDNVYLDSFHRGNPGPGEIKEGDFCGFPYTSRVRSMPILANDRMKNQAIKRLNIRFLDSFLPSVKSIAGSREVQEDSITREEPYNGIIQIPFPGQYDRDVFFEFVHEKPSRCCILAVNAEAN